MKNKIFIFDDDEAILEAAKIILEDKGYQVKTFFNFDDIFDQIDLHRPQLIFVDLWMPKINGEDIIKNLRQKYNKDILSIIVLSANRDTSKIAKNCGADDYLNKPFDISDLEKIVDKYINKHINRQFIA